MKSKKLLNILQRGFYCSFQENMVRLNPTIQGSQMEVDLSRLISAVGVVLVVPMVSGSCCNMLEDSSRSSKASQPETSASSDSMRFLARSRYRSWRSFPIDWRAERRGQTGREGRIRRRDKGRATREHAAL